MSCTLCGWHGVVNAAALPDFKSCSACAADAAHLTDTAKRLLLAMDRTPAAFTIWDQGLKRSRAQSCPLHSQEQPAQLSSSLPFSIYVGDLDDAANVARLQHLNIGLVVNLCPEMISGEYAELPADLAQASIIYIAWPAKDSIDFDFVHKVLRAGIGELLHCRLTHSNVLINCWAGVNRSAAVAIGYLTMWQQRDLLETFREAMRQRGTVLNNRSFRQLLVQVNDPTGSYGVHVD